MSRDQIRGSGLLLAGRGFSTGVKFVSELIVVRYLATSDYGAWTYVLAAVVFLRGFSTLGLNRAIARFVPRHLEHGENRELVGVLTFVSGSLVLAGTIVVTAFYLFPEIVATLAGVNDRQALDLLFIAVLLVPVQTLDEFFTGVCAAFSDSRTIFVRRYLLNPALRLGVALSVVALEAGVRSLAYGFLVAGLAGLVYYGANVVAEMRARGLLERALFRGVRLPARRVLSYTLPVMTADWCSILLATTGPLLLGYFADMEAVALFQVVIPLVALNQLVYQSFGVLFEPSASRIHARNDPHALEHLYWRSALWVAVLTFPVFAASFTGAEPLTVHLFGARYEAAAPILSMLAVGMFLDAILGFNSATLRVVGQVRWLFATNVAGAGLNLVLNLLFIPRWGALGAGVATGTSWFLYAGMKQMALRWATGVRSFHWGYAGLYGLMAAMTAFLVVLRVGWADDLRVLVPGVVLAAGVVLVRARATLSVTDTFPELARVPIIRALLG